MLDLCAQRIDISQPRKVLVSIQLDEAGPRNPLGELSTRWAGPDRVIGAAKHECRHPD
jgi:hypothetical protein